MNKREAWPPLASRHKSVRWFNISSSSCASYHDRGRKGLQAVLVTCIQLLVGFVYRLTQFNGEKDNLPMFDIMFNSVNHVVETYLQLDA